MQHLLKSSVIRAGALLALGAPFAMAGTPTNDIQILFVTDPTLDRVFRLQDDNGDADYDDVGETVQFYDGATGSVLLTEPTCLTASPDDTIYVGDSTENIIVSLRDNNDDLDAKDPGEVTLYFDGRPGGNASNVRLTHINGIVMRFLTVIWVANSNTQVGEIDSILRLEDLNADGDANDAGEAIVFCTLPGSGVGDSVPTAIEIGFDNALYYTDNGTAQARGVWKLDDANHDNSIGAGERSLFYQPASAPNTPVFSSLDVDEMANWYVGDRANNLVYKGRDLDNSSSLTGIEAFVYFAISPSRSFHDLGVKNEGLVVYVPDFATNTTILYCADPNQSGVIEPSIETALGYDDLVAPENIDNPYGVALDFHTHEAVGQEYCGGDTNMCPCGNLGAPDTGCAHALGYGARLLSDGTDGIANDDLVFKVQQLPALAPVLLYSGTATFGGGTGVPFGDGLRCVGGAITRLGLNFADSQGFCNFGPGYATTQAWGVGQTLYFQAWFRDATVGYCSPDTFNLTNGRQVTFTQ